MPPLKAVAKTIRSKNAGVDLITFDIIFPDRESYLLVRDSSALTRQSIAALYNVDIAVVTEFVAFDPANAIKFTLRRRTASGGPGDADVFGSQQYAPLLDIDVPARTDASRFEVPPAEAQSAPTTNSER
jgi:hypothetical protein